MNTLHITHQSFSLKVKLALLFRVLSWSCLTSPSHLPGKVQPQKDGQFYILTEHRVYWWCQGWQTDLRRWGTNCRLSVATNQSPFHGKLSVLSEWWLPHRLPMEVASVDPWVLACTRWSGTQMESLCPSVYSTGLGVKRSPQREGVCSGIVGWRFREQRSESHKYFVVFSLVKENV